MIHKTITTMNKKKRKKAWIAKDTGTSDSNYDT